MALREYQQGLAEKMQQADANDSPVSLLGVESGGEYWLVNLGDAGEVLPVPTLSEVPLTKPWFCGIANIRGTLYSVSDLAAFHGLEPTPLRAQTRLLLTGAHLGNHPGSHIALLVSNTQGLKSMSALEPLSAEPAQQAWRGARYRDAEGRMWSHLLLPVLLNAPEFLDIAI